MNGVYYELHGSIKEDFSFKITYGPENNLVAEIPVSKKDIMAGQEQTPIVEEIPEEDSERIFSIRMPVALSPFQVEKMGRLRVRAHYSDGKILKLGSLGLKQVPEVEFQNMLGLKPTQ